MKSILSCLTILLVAIFTLTGCNHSNTYQKESGDLRINWYLCNFDSIEELKSTFRKYFNNNMTNQANDDHFDVYQITNGASSYLFVKTYNGPLEVPTFNLFCYQKWEYGYFLRYYVPVSEFWYRDILGENLQLFTPTNLVIFNEAEFTKVVYRNKTIIVMSTNWICK